MAQGPTVPPNTISPLFVGTGSPIGTPLAAGAVGGTCTPAIADGTIAANAIGLAVIGPAVDGQRVSCQYAGPLALSLAEWDAILGNESPTGLVPGARYFLSDLAAGMLTQTPPTSSVGAIDVHQIGVALSPNVLLIQLGGGATSQISPPFPVSPTTVTIYARPTGSDVTGDGTLSDPYLTSQRAVRDVPVPPPPGYRYVVDMTGVDEVTPTNYELPAWQTTMVVDEDDTGPYFLFTGAITIQATPQLVASLGADATIAPSAIASQAAQTGSGLLLLTITAPRASWAANALKGKFLIGATALENTVIVESTTTTLLLAQATALTGTLQIMEPSATITCSASPVTNTVKGGFAARNIGSICINGIRILNPTATATTLGLEFSGNGMAIAQLCELQTLFFNSYALNAMRLDRLWMYGLRVRFSGSLTLQASLIDAPSQLNFAALGPEVLNLRRLAVVGGVTVEVCLSNFPGGTISPAPAALFIGEQILIKNIVGATADGFRFHGSRGLLLNADISGCGRDAIRADTGSGFLELNNVHSTSANGVSASGVGVRVNDGMTVKVNAATSAAGTPPNAGVGNDMIVGNLALRTWADFLSGASGKPVKNELDLTAVAGTNGTLSNAAAAPAYVTGTASHLFQP